MVREHCYIMLSIHSVVVLAFVSSAYGVDKAKQPGINKQQDVGILGGHKISIDQAPYMVSLREYGFFYKCGGSIIHERFILTAAHCINKNLNYKVLVGTDRLYGEGTLYDVEKVLIHPMFSKFIYDYDICILKLNETLTFGPKVNKISLNVDAVKLEKGTMLNTTGWGATKHGGVQPEDLLQVTVPMVALSDCRLDYAIQPPHVNITPRMICAGALGEGSCHGDSGGPLTWNNVQVGVTSFGVRCGVFPGVYTRISALHQWIMDTIENNL